MKYSCHFCQKVIDYFQGMIMPVTLVDGTRSQIFTCLTCLDKHDVN